MNKQTIITAQLAFIHLQTIPFGGNKLRIIKKIRGKFCQFRNLLYLCTAFST